MFKGPIQIDLDAKNVTVNHKIDVDPATMTQTENLIKLVGKTAITVIAVAALASSSSEIATHTAKTLIK